MQEDVMSSALTHVLIVDPNKSSRAEVRRLLLQARVVPELVTEVNSADEGLLLYNKILKIWRCTKS